MRNFVGRAMLWLAMLAMCAAGAMAEGGSMFDFNTAPGEDDVQTGWYIENEIYCHVCLVKEGQQIPVSSFCINVPEEGRLHPAAVPDGEWELLFAHHVLLQRGQSDLPGAGL